MLNSSWDNSYCYNHCNLERSSYSNCKYSDSLSCSHNDGYLCFLCTGSHLDKCSNYHTPYYSDLFDNEAAHKCHWIDNTHLRKLEIEKSLQKRLQQVQELKIICSLCLVFKCYLMVYTDHRKR
jgi:hypothetical protein